MATRARQLTEKQQAFVENLLLPSVSQTEAARRAGYSAPNVDGCRLAQNPLVAATLMQARMKEIEVLGGTKAYHTLMDCMDEKYPGSVRVSAAKTMATMAGMLKEHGIADRKEMQEMSPDELVDQLAKLDAAIAKLGTNAKPASAQIITQGSDNAAV